MIHSENFKAPQKLPRVFIQFPINFRPDFDERERRYRERTAALHLWRERERTRVLYSVIFDKTLSRSIRLSIKCRGTSQRFKVGYGKGRVAGP